MYSSLRNRSGSVGRGERESDSSPSLYKTSYGGRNANANTSNVPRYSRASSYDPYSVGTSRTQMTSSYRNPSSSMSASTSSYRNPSMSSSLRNSSSMSSSYSNSTTTGLSSSYHSDYKTRYGSIDQLNSISSYKSPYSSRTTTDTDRGRIGRPTTTSSGLRSSGYLGGSTRDLSTARDSSYKTSLAKYRPPETVSRPSYTPSSYTSTSRTDYRSKTPGLSLSTRDLSQSRSSRPDREYKSMTRFEKTPAREPSTEKDAVEETFQKLYNRYVRDVEVKDTKPAVRKFISHSEAEEDTTDDDSETSTKSLIDNKISIDTTFEPVDDDKTPQSSPKKEEQRDSGETTRNVSEGVKIEPKPIEKELSPIEVKEKEEIKDATTRFLENHPDVKMTTVVIAPRELRPASSAMDKLLRRESLTLKLTDALEKKKAAAPPAIPKANTAKLTATVSINGLTTSSGKNQDKLDTIIERSRTPNSKTPGDSPAMSKESSPAIAPAPRIDAKPAAQITVTKLASPGPKDVEVATNGSLLPQQETKKSSVETKFQSKSVSPRPSDGNELTLRQRSRSPSVKKASSETKERVTVDSQKESPTVSSIRARTPVSTEVSTEKSPISVKEVVTLSPNADDEPRKSTRLRSRSPSVKKLKTPLSKESSPATKIEVTTASDQVSKEISPIPQKPEATPAADPVRSTANSNGTPEKSLRVRSRSPSVKKLKTPVSKESSPAARAEIAVEPAEKSRSREKTPLANGTISPKEKSVTPSTLPPIPKPSTSPKEKSPKPLEITERTLRRRSRSPSTKKESSEIKESTRLNSGETSVTDPTNRDCSPKPDQEQDKAKKLRSRSSSVKRRSATPKRTDIILDENTDQKDKTPEKSGKLARTKLKSAADMLLTGGNAVAQIPKSKPPPLNLNATKEEPSTSVTILCPPTKTRSVSPLPNHLKEISEDMSRSTPGSDPDLEREERSKSVGELERKSVRKRRDPTRTLESLKESLEAELQKKFPQESVKEENRSMVTSQPNVCIPPLLLVTQPSCPATPTYASQNEVFFEANQDSWSDDDEEVDYESDFEYSISQTFKIPSRTPLDLFSASNRNSPFASDYDSDSSMPFLAGTRAEESRGRVDRLFAVPAPTFTCSVTYDGQESWDSDSVHSCEEEFNYAYTVCPRPGSSSLGLYLSPAEYSSDESEDADPDYDGDHFHDSVQVGFTLKLVDKAAMRESDEDDDEYYDEESEYYEEEEEEYTDEDEELWESDEYIEEEIEVEEEEEAESEAELEAFEELEEYSSDEEMMTVMEDMPLKFTQPTLILPSAMTASMAEELLEFEEVEGDFEMEGTFEMAMPMEIDREEGSAFKQREITYTKDMEMMTTEERAEQIEKLREQEEKAVAKRIKKDATSEKAAKLVVTQRVNQMEERVAESNLMEMEDMELLELEGEELPEMTGSSEVNVVPTYVRSQTEKVNEEQTSRFAERKPTSDWAKKAVIQATKLETAKIQKVETKIGEKPQPKKEEPEKVAASSKIGEKAGAASVMSKDTSQGAEIQRPSAAATPTMAANKVPESSALPTLTTTTSKPIEDKSSIRKSALNMKEEEAARKAKADEEAAKQKARRFGTVSALMSRFKDEKKEPEPITYKRSSRLQPKEDERPKKKYEIVQPVINDAFDKQLEELRSQMKTGASQFQNQLKDFSKGISTVSEEAKKRELEEKHKDLLNKTSGTFSKADEEKQRWKVRRDAESEKELAKIQADKGPNKKKVIITPQQPTAEQPREPKRTVRKIIREKKDPNVIVPSFATTGAEKGVTTVAPPIAPSAPVSIPAAPAAPGVVSLPGKITPAPPLEVKVQPKVTPKEKPILVRTDSFQKPSVPQPAGVINENTYDLFAAATAVATKRRKSILELKAQKEAEKQPKVAEPLSGTIEMTVSPAAVVKVPKGDGAAATKIRNALGNATNMPGVKADRTVKRYSTRRRTQEIVNESVQKKCRRKEKQRKNKFINEVQDIDVLLGWDKENTFDKMDSFILRNNQRMATHDQTTVKRRRVENSKVWISDLMDIDKIYKPSEIRDILASVDM